MLMNNLDPENAERPDDLVVYGGTGRAARDWACFDAMVRTLTTLADDEMTVKTWGGFAIDFSKDLPPWDAHGEDVGILKFGPRGGRRLVAHIDALVAAGDVNAWAPKAVRALAQEWPIRAIDTDGLRWTEIDFPADLDRARSMVGVQLRRAA